MRTNCATEADDFEQPGDRLNHLLDKIGFKNGRGRVAEFHSYLCEKMPSVFSDLKYTAVRGWFNKAAPPMRKIDAAMQALQMDYQISYDISQIKTWWKLGGYYPFTEESIGLIPLASRNEDTERLRFAVMAMVTDVTGEDIQKLSTEELVMITDKATRFALNYADPQKTSCPSEYVRMAIKAELSDILKDQR